MINQTHPQKTRDVIPEPSQEKLLLRDMLNTGYDFQKIRIQTGLRIVSRFKKKLGIEQGQKESDIDAKGKQILKELLETHRRITDGIVSSTKKHVTFKNFKGEAMIATFSDYALIDSYVTLLASEKLHFSRLETQLTNFPIYTEYLIDVRGIGPAMSAVLIAYLDIFKAKYPSSYIQYTGLGCGPDGKAMSRKAEHLVDREYTDKNGEIKTKKSITYNPFLRTKVLAVMAAGLLKCKNETYYKIYADRKFRLQNHVTYKDTTDLHRHRCAIRAMMKQFMIDLHIRSSEIEGLPVSVPYHIAKLGYTHGENPRLDIFNERNQLPDDLFDSED